MDPDNYEIPNHFKKTPMTDPVDPQFIESERRIYISGDTWEVGAVLQTKG